MVFIRRQIWDRGMVLEIRWDWAVWPLAKQKWHILEIDGNRGFLKWGYPQIIHFSRLFHELHHPAIGYPHGYGHLQMLSCLTPAPCSAVLFFGRLPGEGRCHQPLPFQFAFQFDLVRTALGRPAVTRHDGVRWRTGEVDMVTCVWGSIKRMVISCDFSMILIYIYICVLYILCN